jgi:Cysteine sulfinate desulfinase/cysteine desulfurase and related enzymes
MCIRDSLREIKMYLYERLFKEIPDVELNGTLDNSLPHILNVTFKYIEGESIALRLDFEGIGVTTGSACYSRNLQASHVLLAMGKSHEDSHGSIRFSLSKYNTKEEIDYTIEKLKEIVDDLRRISPLLGGK